MSLRNWFWRLIYAVGSWYDEDYWLLRWMKYISTFIAILIVGLAYLPLVFVTVAILLVLLIMTNSEGTPEMRLKASGFNSTIELEDSKSFEHAAQILDTLKQIQHGESLELETSDTEPGISEEDVLSLVEYSLDQIKDTVNRMENRTSETADRR